MNSSQSYAFVLTVHAMQDGAVKVAHAADPLGSAREKQFWATLYGSAPDPALNLPLRFVRNVAVWIPNTAISREQMRGFLVMTADPAAPVIGEYDILALALVDGHKVRVSAQIYNYSTGQPFSNCLVQFYAIKYNSVTNQEIGDRIPICLATIALTPLGTSPAQIIWDTTGFGGPVGGQDYRIYADLNYNNAIQEIYPPEIPGKQYKQEQKA
jgi:hypothetical protein